MIIIVEGPDGSGKSTLANNLSEKLGKKVLHTGGQSSTPGELIGRVKIIEANPDCIVDRFPYLSEIVYRQHPLIIDHKTLLSKWEEFKEKNNIYLIYCKTDLKTMYENISHEKKAHKPPKYLEEVKRRHPRIVDLYDQLFCTIGFDITYNWQEDGLPCVD
jgi:tRNA A37 N6-isopentenylltransferase MiaA|tara:strand:+ start:1321 stop:1800 length:480 start_codon:yes stop_codon:yes gene_type:complete